MSRRKMKTPLTYYGGKQLMLKHILPLVPFHNIYNEPFFGGGALYWAKKEVRCEMINDINNNIIAFYEIIKGGRTKIFDRLVQTSLISYTQYLKANRIFWGRIKSNKPEKAWAVWFLGNLAFCGNFDGGIKFSKSPERSYRFLINSKKNILNPTIIKRLEKTQINCRDALGVISMMDSKATFHYLDPPYMGADQGHYSGYTEKQFIELLEICSKLEGKFLLSCYSGTVINIFIEENNWNCRRIKRYSGAAVYHGKRVNKIEFLIYNYTEPDKQIQLI